MTDTPTPAMTPEQRAELVAYCDYCHDGMQADGETPCPCVADREMVALRAERDAAQAEIARLAKINVKLCADFNLMNQHGAKQDTEIARLTAALDAERDRCMRIVSAARNGDIDQDMRTLLHFMDCGDQMVFDADKHEYIPDHVAKDRALIAAITKGAAT